LEFDLIQKSSIFISTFLISGNGTEHTLIALLIIFLGTVEMQKINARKM